MVHTIRAYSRRHIVAACVVFMMLFGLLVWHQGDHITKTISNATHKSPESNNVPAVDDHDPTSVPTNLDNYGQDSQPTAEPTPAASAGSTSKTKPRFWTSKGHLLPSVWDYKRPEGVRSIKALVFFGRRQPVSILDCYLKRNLKKNGGMLDGVVFVLRTSEPKDLALLERMMQSEPEYYEKWTIKMANANQFSSGFGNSYDRVEDDVLYIKIDDDIVFMEDSVIPSIIQKKFEHPEYYIVSANVVNQPLLSWVHWNLNAVKPYFPELNETYDISEVETDWRASTLPTWEEPESGQFDFEKWEPSDKGAHRWLPVNRDRHDHVLDRTPIEKTEYHPYGRGWTMWKIGAQEHFSFLENLENDELFHYKFNTWDFQYDRMGIQFVAMMGHDINLAKPIESDDENHFSRTMPMRLGRHAVADGRGIAVHYSFGSQRNGMDKTDILERYRTFARENICEEPMLWSPQDEAEEVKMEKAKKKLEEEAKKQEEEAKKKDEEAKKKDEEARKKADEEAKKKAEEQKKQQGQNSP